jgi:hypothetical protein
MKMKQVINVDVLCGAIAIGCLVVLGVSTVSANNGNTYIGGPAGGYCGSDHCGEPPELTYNFEVVYRVTNTGVKDCCVFYRTAYNGSFRSTTRMDWIDYSYYTRDKDKLATWNYWNCTWTRSYWDRSSQSVSKKSPSWYWSARFA